jgi:hypothetical protein
MGPAWNGVAYGCDYCVGEFDRLVYRLYGAGGPWSIVLSINWKQFGRRRLPRLYTVLAWDMALDREGPDF